jgi:tetratricopeptide (TPR) repeat protein
MSDVNWRLITRRRDHTFQPPVPEMTARYGVPNACTTCHEDKSPEWAAVTMDKWYGNHERRQVVAAMADTLYRAGAGDMSVLPELAGLAVNRSNGSLIRASAAEFLGRLLARNPGSGTDGSSGSPQVGTAVPGPAIVNALIGAADDREPIVRIAAVRSLGLIPTPRLVPVLAAHLVDEARIVRVRAAEALFNIGVTSLDGPPGRALGAAQGEWAASLRTFNDSAADHVTLGRLQAARGRIDEAIQELNAANKLNPSIPQPHLQLGLIAARAGRYDEALREFKAVQLLAPTYPNIDRLIEEAQKRR